VMNWPRANGTTKASWPRLNALVELEAAAVTANKQVEDEAAEDVEAAEVAVDVTEADNDQEPEVEGRRSQGWRT
jgi:hypothetical protein